VLKLDDDSATVSMLISSMYDPLGCTVSWSNVKPLLELARKYDVEDIQLKCDQFLDAEPVSTSNLPHYLDLACAFAEPSVVEQTHDYIAAADNYKDIMRCVIVRNPAAMMMFA
jgi:BTB/POZ domain